MTLGDTGRGLVPSRIVVTGLNGSGKTHFAQKLSHQRPELPLISFDALKLTTHWNRRPHSQSETALRGAIAAPFWLLDTGASGLLIAATRATHVVYLDTPVLRRATRLFLRPLRNRGQTRATLPDGNVDYLWQQLRFGTKSLLKTKKARATLERAIADLTEIRMIRCRTETEVSAALAALSHKDRVP